MDFTSLFCMSICYQSAGWALGESPLNGAFQALLLGLAEPAPWG